MNIVVPAAGRGSRFREAGYKDPKPLIPVDGKPMIARVLTSFLGNSTEHRIVAVVQEGFPRLYGVENAYLDHTTDGAARSVTLGIHIAQLPLDEPLLIVNSDQLVEFDFGDFLAKASGAEGSLIVFPVADQSRAWSYAEIRNERIVRVAEKEPISQWATAGFYWWRTTAGFLEAAGMMMSENDRTNGEFYVAPTYNYSDGEIVPYYVPASAFHSLGTPEDLEKYLEWRKHGGGDQ